MKKWHKTATDSVCLKFYQENNVKKYSLTPVLLPRDLSYVCCSPPFLSFSFGRSFPFQHLLWPFFVKPTENTYFSKAELTSHILVISRKLGAQRTVYNLKNLNLFAYLTTFLTIWVSQKLCRFSMYLIFVKSMCPKQSWLFPTHASLYLIMNTSSSLDFCWDYVLIFLQDFPIY